MTHVLDLTMTALIGPLWSFMLASMSCDCLPILHMRTMPAKHNVTVSHGKHMQHVLTKSCQEVDGTHSAVPLSMSPLWHGAITVERRHATVQRFTTAATG